jgi:nucleotide-binding universal stress UspA family protein
MVKTIIVHVDGSPEQEARMHAAALLARDYGAHVVGSAATGIAWLDFALLAGAMAAPAPAADFDGMRTLARLRLDEFSAQAARLGIPSVETRLIEDVPQYGLLLQSRYADLVILGQDQDQDQDETAPGLPARVRRLPEHVALHGVRPVLVVPPGYRGAPLPGTVVAGWDGSQQALRAMTAALPLLVRADAVKLALVNPDALATQHGEQPGADLARWLARHGVRVDVVLEQTTTTAGHALAALARDSGAGLMVCGAYGHSRYREWMLGGVTRELLARAPVPLLIAH